ncbi:MAG: hypothetical protein EPO21_16145 [Chloroflexota bacterium]|nr:MAG: hypothetical protein EPO21_16145 [Chloroflexota bacterium]
MSSLIRNAEIQDEPVVIRPGQDDWGGAEQPLVCDDMDGWDAELPVPIDPLVEREEELRERESRVDRLEAQLLEQKSQLESKIAQLDALVRNAHLETAALLRDAEHQALDLAVAIARRLLRAELKLHPEMIARVVEEALETTGRHVVVRIRVAPEELSALRNVWETSPPALISRDVSLVADPKVQPGGCIIDTQTGTADGRLESQWEAIEAAFHNMERESRANDD